MRVKNETCLDIYYLMSFILFDNLLLVRIFLVDRAIQNIKPLRMFCHLVIDYKIEVIVSRILEEIKLRNKKIYSMQDI